MWSFTIGRVWLAGVCNAGTGGTLKVDDVEYLICTVLCSHYLDKGDWLLLKFYQLPGPMDTHTHSHNIIIIMRLPSRTQHDMHIMILSYGDTNY